MRATNNKWYVSIQNKAKGPYSDLQMRNKIKTGELSGDTLTYKEGEPDWLPLEKQDIWTPSFVPKNEFTVKDSKEWVLLVESPIKQGDYQQQGPFTREEVAEKVAIGEVHLKDFCWRPGMENWKSLVQMPELGFPRKEKIEFTEAAESYEKTSSFESELEEKKDAKVFEPLPGIDSEMPEFVEPDALVQKEKEDVLHVSPMRRLLPPIIDKYGERKEILAYLVLVAALFLGSFTLGSYNSTNILKGVESVGSGVVSFVQKMLPATPQVSYVFLRELPLTKGTILVKTDGNPGIEITARLKNEKGITVRTRDGKKYLSLKTNKNGEAFLGLSQFKVKTGETYIVTTKAGHLTAKKTYFYSK